MYRELDYRSEAARQIYFKQNVHVPLLDIPTVYEKYSSDCVLVQSRATGSHFPDVLTWSEREKTLIAETLLKTLFTSLFIAGEIHADPHNGNALFNHENQGKMVTLLDFGCTVSLSHNRRLTLLKLILGCKEQNAINPFDCFVALGFDANKLVHIHGALPLLCEYLFYPFLVDYQLDIRQWQLSKKINDLLGEQRWWFRSAGCADLFLLMRAFQGVLQKLEQLNVFLNWWEMLQQCVEDVVFYESRALIVPSVNLPTLENAKSLDFASQAKKLRVTVIENNVTKVALEMPANAALNLESIIPADTLVLIKQDKQIGFDKLMRGLKLDGLRPQKLFKLLKENKEYHVWLE